MEEMRVRESCRGKNAFTRDEWRRDDSARQSYIERVGDLVSVPDAIE